jgi:dTDP-4-dehydrorhamnose reductase
MKRVLITGAHGFLGKRLVKILSKTKEFDLDILMQDITDPHLHIEPSDILIHLAAKHPSNKGDILKVNYEATKSLARLCSKDTHFIFLSTDYVFKEDESKQYFEDSKKEPETEYGISKSLAEEYLKQTLNNVAIIRTSMLYGYYNEQRNNFIQFLIKELGKNKKIEVFADVFSRPTHVDDLSEFIIGVIRNKTTGTFHAASKDYLSRFEIANIFCQTNNLNKDLLMPVKRDSFMPRNINMRPSDKFIKSCTISLENGLSYNLKEGLV